MTHYALYNAHIGQDWKKSACFLNDKVFIIKAYQYRQIDKTVHNKKYSNLQ